MSRAPVMVWVAQGKSYNHCLCCLTFPDHCCCRRGSRGHEPAIEMPGYMPAGEFGQGCIGILRTGWVGRTESGEDFV